MTTETKNDPVEPLALSREKAAQALGISERLLWSKTNTGEIPSRRVGRRVLYPVHLLRERLDQDA